MWEYIIQCREEAGHMKKDIRDLEEAVGFDAGGTLQ